MKTRLFVIGLLFIGSFVGIGLMENQIAVTAQNFGEVKSVNFQILEKCLNGVSSNLEKCLKR